MGCEEQNLWEHRLVQYVVNVCKLNGRQFFIKTKSKFRWCLRVISAVWYDSRNTTRLFLATGCCLLVSMHVCDAEPMSHQHDLVIIASR